MLKYWSSVHWPNFYIISKVIELEDASFCNFFDLPKTLKGMDSILDMNTTLTFWHIHSIVHIEHLLFSIRSLNTSNLLVRISMRQDFQFHTKKKTFNYKDEFQKRIFYIRLNGLECFASFTLFCHNQWCGETSLVDIE